jgi:hypothetical protein
VTAVALVVYAFLLAIAGVAVWRRPVVALPIFVVGLAVHNAAMDALYGAGLHGHALTVIQAWKDVLLLVAVARVVFVALRTRALPFRPVAADWIALAFAALVVVYALIPQDWLGGDATHKGIAYALRHDLTGVAAYFVGRATLVDFRRIAWTIAAVAAAVAAWGLIDVYAISLDWWRHNGTVAYFRDQLEYHYTPALSGLPENFLYNTGNENDVLRRLISTFVSPLGSAYLFLVALLLMPRARVAVPMTALAAAGLLWTYTRAAIIALALGFAVLALVRRRAWPFAAAVATVVVGLVFVQAFPDIGPKAHYTQVELAWQRSHAKPSANESPTSASEPSVHHHFAALRAGLHNVVHHPQGFGLGNAGEVANRTIPNKLKAGESNYTEIGVETGLAGMLLFIAWNLALLSRLVRARRAALAAVLAAVLVVAIQTDAYGIPWLAYCVWWLAGSGADAPEPREGS